MGINIKTPHVHHVCLRVSDFERAKLGKDYVAFKDPDRISWEFYMA